MVLIVVPNFDRYHSHYFVVHYGYPTFVIHRLEFQWYTDLARFDLAICEFLNVLQHILVSLYADIAQQLQLVGDKIQFCAIL